MPEVLGRLRPPRLASAPVTPVGGELYYDTATTTLYWWNGTTWISASAGSQGVNGGWKASVRAATTANITLSGTQTIDQIALVVGDRVLVKDQTAQAQNGIYVVAAGAWSRASDADTWNKLVMAMVPVENRVSGNTNAMRAWTTNSEQGGTLGTSPIWMSEVPVQLGIGTDRPYAAMPGSMSVDYIANTNYMTGSMYMNDQKITSMADPTSAQGAATKAYVDKKASKAFAMAVA